MSGMRFFLRDEKLIIHSAGHADLHLYMRSRARSRSRFSSFDFIEQRDVSLPGRARVARFP